MTTKPNMTTHPAPTPPASGPDGVELAPDGLPAGEFERGQHFKRIAQQTKHQAKVNQIIGMVVDCAKTGCSGSYLAEYLGVTPTADIRHLANILTCANESKEVQEALSKLHL